MHPFLHCLHVDVRSLAFLVCDCIHHEAASLHGTPAAGQQKQSINTTLRWTAVTRGMVPKSYRHVLCRLVSALTKWVASDMASPNACNCCNMPVCIHKVFGLLVGSCLCPSQPKLSWYATRIRSELPECRPKIRAHPQSQLVRDCARNCLLHMYLIYQYFATSWKNADWFVKE